jgi:hypothetical protein
MITYTSVWHGTALPSGEILVSAQFASDYSQNEFESHSSVDVVGAEYDGTAITDKHVSKLASLGVCKGHTTKDVRRLAKQKNRLM